MRDRIARQLVRLYPRAWRARYEDEFLALLEAHGSVGWRVAFDIGLGAAREWGRWLAARPRREPMGHLKVLRRQASVEIFILVASAVLIDLVARAIASGFARAAYFDLPGLSALLFIQAAAALRCSWGKSWSRTPRADGVRAAEMTIWCVAILAGATLAHLDRGLSALGSFPWWARWSPTPAFGVAMSLMFLGHSTPAARARIRRVRELKTLRLRVSVPSRPIGLL